MVRIEDSMGWEWGTEAVLVTRCLDKNEAFPRPFSFTAENPRQLSATLVTQFGIHTVTLCMVKHTDRLSAGFHFPYSLLRQVTLQPHKAALL